MFEMMADVPARQAVENVACQVSAALTLLVEKGVLTNEDLERIPALMARLRAMLDQEKAKHEAEEMARLEKESPAMAMLARLFKRAAEGGV